jgi:hypothetical protein
MVYWLFKSARGEFSIIERSSKGVDAVFWGHPIGHFANPAEAATAVGSGAFNMPQMFGERKCNGAK